MQQITGRFLRRLAGMLAIMPLLALLPGCEDTPHNDRIARELARLEAQDRARAETAPAPPGFTYTVTEKAALTPGMTRAQVEARLPRAAGDPADMVAGDYRISQRRLPGGRTLSLTFVRDRLAVLGAHGRYTALEAGRYRAALEKQLGPPRASGSRLEWTKEDPPQTALAFFESESDGYVVDFILKDNVAARELDVEKPITPPPM